MHTPDAMETELKIELASDPQWLRVVRGVVERWCSGAGFSEEACRQVTLAVDEAMANIIRHAYGGRGDQPVVVTCRRNAAAVEFLLEDRGVPVDRAQICRHPPDELRPGGRGTHLMQQIMDEVHYETEAAGNRVRLVKYRPR
jgi:anti-sigma regulatory factor (Ser/Thr protein kinase)